MPRVGFPRDLPIPELLPRSKLDLIYAGSRRVRYPAGKIVLRPGDPDFIGFLAGGLGRAYIVSPDGRQVTVRYIGAGDLIGGMAALHQPFQGYLQLLVESRIDHLNMVTFRKLVATDPAIAEALATALALRLNRTIEALAINSFGSITQCLAYDVLERASREQLQSGRLEAVASNQEFADAIGSVREVVARAIHDMRRRGLIETSRRRVRVLEPTVLASLATSAFNVEPGRDAAPIS